MERTCYTELIQIRNPEQLNHLGYEELLRNYDYDTLNKNWYNTSRIIDYIPQGSILRRLKNIAIIKDGRLFLKEAECYVKGHRAYILIETFGVLFI